MEAAAPVAGNARSATPLADMAWLPGGKFVMGSDRHYPEEAPAHEVTVDGFWIDVFPVTNLAFKRFVDATHYVTSAERAPRAQDYPGAQPEQLVPASVVFAKPNRPVDMSNAYNWWAYVPGANWRHPQGPRSNLNGRWRHPVVHLAYEDAVAYADWAGKSLPTEAEWEFAARGGLDQAEYCWGDDFTPDGRFMANTWQGAFPHQNLAADRFEWTSPVGSFPPNGYGLYDMAGNVWEWTSDWFVAHGEKQQDCCGSAEALRDQSYDPRAPVKIPRKVMKGGSFLCAPNYCLRYRPAARMGQPIDTSTCHLGLRCVVRPPKA